MTTYYLTGLTALNLPIEGRIMPGWWSTWISNTKAWSIAGINTVCTEWLLGLGGVYDATKSIEMAGVDILGTVCAANYERALFDLIFEFFVIRGRPVPNIQARDIDGCVDFEVVMRWIDLARPFIHFQKLRAIKTWIEDF